MTASVRSLNRTDLVLFAAIAAVVASVAIAGFSPRGGTLDDRARAIEVQLRCPTMPAPNAC